VFARHPRRDDAVQAEEARGIYVAAVSVQVLVLCLAIARQQVSS
jgi:hypothetical protein